eukprot:TRINITY_DN10678_c0_g1_i3.p1 TRINITY_DN10678_c0_g1~~TRINITY_DN10678_c0_g1_i3.p1  ORF type:complete len:292 (+),score=69.37 TRINITY_DN10678_c0_g1_i3:644-1519(+)
MLKLVEQMRKRKLNNEIIIREEKRIEAQKLEKQNESKRNRRKELVPHHSYAISGEFITIASLAELPEIAPKCGAARKESLVTPKLSRKLSRNLTRKFTFLKPLADSEPKTPDEAATHPDFYSSLVPVLGVTFAEAGKEPKTSKGSLSQRIGRLTRSEFQAMACNASRSSFVVSGSFALKEGGAKSLEGKKAEQGECGVSEREWKKASNAEISDNIKTVLVENCSLRKLHDPNALSILPVDRLKRKSELVKEQSTLNRYNMIVVDDTGRNKAMEQPQMGNCYCEYRETATEA